MIVRDYEQQVLQEVFDKTSDLLAVLDDEPALGYDTESIRQELSNLMQYLQRASSEPLLRSTNIYGRDGWFTPDDIKKVE